MSFTLSAEQERCRTAALAWYNNPHRDKPWFLVQGAAGSGKSAIITATTESIKGKVLYAAPTGKAALVMSQKGCPGAQTIHSLIYRPNGLAGRRHLVEQYQEEIKHLDPESDRFKLVKRLLDKELSDVKPLFTLNVDSPLRSASLLVVDELSMVPQTVVEDLFSFGVPILLQGDPFQLPPVKATSYFQKAKPDFLLTEIHRQAKDSPIIHLATLAREGKPLPLGDYGDSKVVRKVSVDDALAHDQIIVGRNKTRHAKNAKIRLVRGYTEEYPMAGERVICLRNNAKLGLMNGDHFQVDGYDDVTDSKCLLDINNSDINMKVIAHKDYFVGKEPSPWDVPAAECFAYGYVITCHKSQGSQWDAVYVIDESKDFAGSENAWRYTAITRAAKRVTIEV